MPHFHGPLNIENDSADGASVYYGHVLVIKCFLFSDEPITSVLEDLKSLTSAVMKDDLSSSDEDEEDWAL